MALHDTDPDSPLRDSPSPAVGDTVGNGRMAHQTASTAIGAPGAPKVARVQQQNNRILAVDANNVPVVNFGQQQDGSLGLRVAKTGIDVTTNTDPSQLIFNSSQDVFKIVGTGTITQTQGAFTGTVGTFQEFFGTVSILHNLSYTPVVLAFLYLGGTYVPMPYTAMNNTGAGPNWVTYAITTDSTSINFNYVGITYGATTVASSNLSAKYYLLQETAN